MKKIMVVLLIIIVLLISGCGFFKGDSNSEDEMLELKYKSMDSIDMDAYCNDDCLILKKGLESFNKTKECGVIVSGECREAPNYFELDEQGKEQGIKHMVFRCGSNKYKYCDCELESGKFMSEDEDCLDFVRRARLASSMKS